jgi:hypothetical protein
MASSYETLSGRTIGLHPQERVRPVVKLEPKPSFTPSQIDQITQIVPQSLKEDNPVETPVGIWHQEGKVTIFDFKSAEELAQITIPEPKERRKQGIIKAIKFITQMS